MKRRLTSHGCFGASPRGEEVVIARAGKPVARLVPVDSRGPRQIGRDRGALTLPADFDAPLPAEVLDAFAE